MSVDQEKKRTMYTELFRNLVFLIFMQLKFCDGFFLPFFDVLHLTYDDSLSLCSIIDDIFTSLAQSFPHTSDSHFNC